jgi:hypothetical protein
MANLKRYDILLCSDSDTFEEVDTPTGKYVKFADIKEFLPTTHNKQSAPCQHQFDLNKGSCIHCGMSHSEVYE